MLEREIATSRPTFVAINNNPFNKLLYVDVVIDSDECRLRHKMRVYYDLFKWLIKLLNLNIVKNYRVSVPAHLGTDPIFDEVRKLMREFSEQEIRSQLPNIFGVFISLISSLLPKEWKCKITEFVSDVDDLPILIKVKYRDNEWFDQVTETLRKATTSEADRRSKPRLQELKAIYSLVRRSRADFILVCAEKFILFDPLDQNKEKREFDGLIVEIFAGEIRLTIVEAKKKSTSAQNEKEALKQLETTKQILDLRRPVIVRTRKIKGLGAYLRYTFPMEA